MFFRNTRNLLNRPSARLQPQKWLLGWLFWCQELSRAEIICNMRCSLEYRLTGNVVLEVGTTIESDVDKEWEDILSFLLFSRSKPQPHKPEKFTSLVNHLALSTATYIYPLTSLSLLQFSTVRSAPITALLRFSLSYPLIKWLQVITSRWNKLKSDPFGTYPAYLACHKAAKVPTYAALASLLLPVV